MRRCLGLLCLLAVAGCGGGRRERVIVLGLDGLDPQAVELLAGEGKLPHFDRLRRDGSSGRIASSGDLLISPVLWTTIATGKPPEAHGINHFVAVNPKTGAALPVTSRMRQVRSIWEIASEAGRRVGVVGWWATWPAEGVNGAVVSDHTCYHFLFGKGAEASTDDTAVTSPPGLIREIAPLIRRPTDVTAAEAAPFLHVPAEELQRPFDFRDPVSHFKWALATAESYRQIGLRLWQTQRPELLLVYVEGTDSVSHLFGHLFRTQGLAGELAEQQARFGSAVEEMYRYADRLVGDYMAAMDDHTTLVVLSDHGFALGRLPEDPSEARDLRRVSEKYHRPEGVFYAYGRRVRRGAMLPKADHLDVTPTVLALLGLARARDMPGHALESVLDASASSRATIATYETRPRRAGPELTDETANGEILARLKSLGYLETRDSAQAQRNIAERHFQAQRYAEAAAIYRELLVAEPRDAALRTSLAGALAGLKQYDAALQELGHALELDPLQAPAYHNRGAIYELQGRPKEAVREYRAALRYRPGYGPSAEALKRLAPEGEPPRPASEARAVALAEQARDAAQRGDFPGARSRLAEAERLAPRLALIYQYEANVAYLMNDRPAAIAALKKALSLEPDNALFRSNLLALQEEATRP